MFLPLVIQLAALPFLPDLVPTHYGIADQVTRWGSKYQSLIFPMATALTGAILLGISRISARQDGIGKKNARSAIETGYVCLVIFNVLSLYFLYLDFQHL